MHDYSAYGLIIRSDLELPELVAAPAHVGAPAPRPTREFDVRLVTGPINRRPPSPFPLDAAVWATSDAAFLDYPGVVAFLVERGTDITLDVRADADARLVRLFLLGPVLALLLHQRHFLVLHASAVNVGGGAVAFVADKGMGKSTLAAAMHARGHALVADDIVAIDTTAPHPVAYPGFPQLKLFPESAALLVSSPRNLPKVHPDMEKRAAQALVGFPTAPLALKRVFVLVDAQDNSIEPLSPSDGFMELVRHTYLLGFLNATRSAAAHFRQTISVASRVPVIRLCRRHDLGGIASVAQLVEDDLGRAS